MSTVAVIDYGMGNLRSVCKAIEHVAPDTTVILTGDPAAVRRAARVVFPGQGAIGGCVRAMGESGLRDALLDVIHKRPFLGICLGLQALYDYSEEDGGTAGLSILAGEVKHFPMDQMRDANGQALKVPHMGWNQVHQTGTHPLWRDIPQDSRFYFVHSYYAESAEAADIAGTTAFGIRFTSAAACDNIFAVQFHPEKSQHAGLQLLTNFTRWDGSH
jgi:imidazole glycerol-phosphate synthase subunit HisH